MRKYLYRFGYIGTQFRKMDSYLPPEWKDEERMRVLMGPLPLAKDSVSLNSRITFWTAVLYNWNMAKNGLTFTLNDAQMAFRRGTQVPLCFPQIFDLLIRQGEFISFEDLITPSSNDESWATWSKRVLLATPSKWAWKTIQSTVGPKNLENKVYIHCKALQAKSERLLSFYWGLPKEDLPFSPEEVISVEDLFRCLGAPLGLSFEDLNIALHYLSKDRRIAILEHEGGVSLVKVARPGQTEPLIITQMEAAEFQFRSTEEKLKTRLDCVQKEATALTEEARRCVRSGTKNQALSALRRKKRCEKSIEGTLSALENVSCCLNQIQESKLNINVLNAFQLGANALKCSIASMGGADEVSTAMDTLSDVLDECHDIADTMSFGGQSAEDMDETGLEAELNELMVHSPSSVTRVRGVGVGDSEQTARSSEAYGLPDVPHSNPLHMAHNTGEMENN